MHAMSGMRGFSLGERRGRCVSCGSEGVFVGGVPLLQRSPSYGRDIWSVRSVADVNVELTALYRVPIDVTPKLAGMSLAAAAFNRGDTAMAAIAAVQMQFPDPPLARPRAAEVAGAVGSLADSWNFHQSAGRGLAHRLPQLQAQRRSHRHPLTHSRSFLSRRGYRGSAHPRRTPTSPGKTARPAADALEMRRRARKMQRLLLSLKLKGIKLHTVRERTKSTFPGAAQGLREALSLISPP